MTTMKGKEEAVEKLAKEIYMMVSPFFFENQPGEEQRKFHVVARLILSRESELRKRHREVLEKVKCLHCEGSGKTMWNRKPISKCIFCKGSGYPSFIDEALARLGEEGGGVRKLKVHKQWFQSNPCTSICSRYGFGGITSFRWKKVTCKKCLRKSSQSPKGG